MFLPTVATLAGVSSDKGEGVVDTATFSLFIGQNVPLRRNAFNEWLRFLVLL
jgi:hypothetical protein